MKKSPLRQLKSPKSYQGDREEGKKKILRRQIEELIELTGDDWELMMGTHHVEHKDTLAGHELQKRRVFWALARAVNFDVVESAENHPTLEAALEELFLKVDKHYEEQ